MKTHDTCLLGDHNINHIESRFYGISELIEASDEWEDWQKTRAYNLWVKILRKLTCPVRQRGANQALKELEEGFGDGLEVESGAEVQVPVIMIVKLMGEGMMEGGNIRDT